MNIWNWVVIAASALTILIILLWRNFNIDEITPTPPFVKLKRKAKSSENPTTSGQELLPNFTNIRKNLLIGKNKVKVDIQTMGVNVDSNKILGENEINVDFSSESKSKIKKSRISK